VPALSLEMPRHGIPHHAEPNPRNLCHAPPSKRSEIKDSRSMLDDRVGMNGRAMNVRE
jgi:hypothetical protein